MIRRNLSSEIQKATEEFKITCITGPGQSGKTAFCQSLFKRKPYVSLENPDIALEAIENPRKFLARFPKGAVLDEVHRVPQLFHFLKEMADKSKKNNPFVIIGNYNFLTQSGINQSLARKSGYVHLLPFSLNEFTRNKKRIRHHDEHILQGFFPSVVTGRINAFGWYENYVKTFVEREIRQLKYIDNLLLFNRFLKLCASRSGQLLNIASLAKDAQVDAKTAASWIELLESCYLVFRLHPFQPGFDKRVSKTPKLYFYDTGVLCYLLGIKNKTALRKYHHYGAIFENLVVAEIKKNRFNKDQTGNLFFFRDHVGNEVDLVIQRGNELIPVEIKSAEKLSIDHLHGLKWFNRTFRLRGGILIYTGKKEGALLNEYRALNWKKVADL